MNRLFVSIATLLFVAFIGLAETAIGATLPLSKRLFIMSDVNNHAIEIDPTAVSTLSAKVQLAVPSNKEWQLLPVPGQPGRVLIHQTTDDVLLAADLAANDTDPALLKVLARTADPPTSAQWRLIETTSRAYLIMNVESGRLLDADNSVPAGAITKVQLLGGDATTPTATNQWRLFPPGTSSKKLDIAKCKLPAIGLTEPMLSVLTVPDANTDVTVSVKIVGHGTSQLTAQVTVNATSGGKAVKGTLNQSIQNSPGKKILLDDDLPRISGQVEQTLTYKVPTDPTSANPLYSVVVPFVTTMAGVKTADVGPGIVTITPPTPLAPDPLKNNIMMLGEWMNTSGAAVGNNRLTLFLEQIPFFEDLD